MLSRHFAVVMFMLGAFTVHAQEYPTKPIRVLHGFSAGGPPDAALRVIAKALETRLGQPVVVENHVGASGTIAAGLVARAPADGYSLLFGVAANLAVAPAASTHPPYDPTKMFTPIIEVARGPYLWLVPATSPARSLAEFIALAKKEPGKLNYGTPGIASVHHLATETFARSVGIQMTHVPFGTAGLYAGILGGQIDAMFESMPGPLPHIRAGKLRALAVTGPNRLPSVGDVPTFREQGIPDPAASSWWGFVGPPGLPDAIVKKLNREITAVLGDPAVASTFEQMSIRPSPDTPAAFGEYIAAQYAHWRQQARMLDIELN